MMMVSASFADWIQYHSVTTGETIFYDNHYFLIGSPVISGASYVAYVYKPTSCGNWYISSDYKIQYYQCTDTGTNIKIQTYTYPMTSSNSCPSGQSVDANGVCITPDPLECDPTKGTFTNLDGQCTDCSSHLSDKDVDSMANCACGSTGSSWNNGSVYSNSVTSGNKTYWQSKIRCADSSEKVVYYGEVTPSDTNNTTPPTDTNSTTPTDNNTSVPTDNNNTKPTDGNGTIPTDGNGTKPGTGKDYTSLLNTIIENLKNVSGNTDSTSKGINGSYPVEANSLGMPSDTSGGSWNDYSDAWQNIVNSLDEVTNSVSDLQGLISNGFTSPFSKTSVTSCSYTTSFEFGEVGTIPVTVDFCKIFSPLHGVIYTFSYLFFVFCILLFHVKMFLRLV